MTNPISSHVIQAGSGVRPHGASISPGAASFAQVLHEKAQVQPLRFSGHALERMRQRNIALTHEQAAKLDESVKRAQMKGVKSSLVLLDDLALIVSVQNRTVITAVDGKSLKENIFTNIDSAIII
jgi:flagellar operon protein